MNKVTRWDIAVGLVIALVSIVFFDAVLKQLGENLLNVLVTTALSFIFATVLWYIQMLVRIKLQK